MNKILTVKTVSEYLDISISSIYKKTSNKEIPFYKPNNGRLYFKKEEIDKWLLAGRVGTIDEGVIKLFSNLKAI